MYINPKKKPRLLKKQAKDETFIRNHPDLYTAYRNRGHSHTKAIQYARKELSQKKTKKGTKSLERLKSRYTLNVERPGVASIDISDIPRSKAVNIWIQDKVYKGDLVDKGYQLKFPKDEKLGRY